MPQHLTVVRFSPEEKDLLADVAKPQHIDNVIKEFRAATKDAGTPLTQVSKSPDLTADDLTRAQSALHLITSLLANLPDGDATNAYRSLVGRADHVVGEGLAMITGAPTHNAGQIPGPPREYPAAG